MSFQGVASREGGCPQKSEKLTCFGINFLNLKSEVIDKEFLYFSAATERN